MSGWWFCLLFLGEWVVVLFVVCFLYLFLGEWDVVLFLVGFLYLFLDEWVVFKNSGNQCRH